jgi:hypothetical protein
VQFERYNNEVAQAQAFIMLTHTELCDRGLISNLKINYDVTVVTCYIKIVECEYKRQAGTSAIFLPYFEA